MGLHFLSNFLTASTLVFFLCLFRFWKFTKYGLEMPEINWPKYPSVPVIMQTFLDHRIYPLMAIFPLLLICELIFKQLIAWED
jgi:hypothetical protein